jgi:hypothetical protein
LKKEEQERRKKRLETGKNLLLTLPGTLSALLADPFTPRFIPAFTPHRRPQGYHGIHLFGCPMHSCSLETTLHHRFIGALHHA